MTFMRYEIKYMISREQKQLILETMKPYMELDQHGCTAIRNVYYDTDNFRLIRRSIEKPVYKEKLRIRSYGRATEEDKVFVELKKKYLSVVYKRRIRLPQFEAFKCLQPEQIFSKQTQIAREIEYFRDFYHSLRPVVFLSYEREAFCAIDGSDVRITFDDNILYRTEELTLDSEAWGNSILDENKVILEIKVPGAIPLWMTKCLTQNNIFKTSFSKYGTAYQKIQENKIQEDKRIGDYAYA